MKTLTDSIDILIRPIRKPARRPLWFILDYRIIVKDHALSQLIIRSPNRRRVTNIADFPVKRHCLEKHDGKINTAASALQAGVLVTKWA